MNKVRDILLVASLFFSGGGLLIAAITGYDFNRYQVILDKKPFGEVTPSEGAQTQTALSDVISKELEMKAIIDDGTGIRIGFLDKKSNKNFFLGVGENHDGLQVVSINYENEEAVVKKGSETAVVKLRPDKDKDKTVASAGPAAMGESPFQLPPAASQPAAAVRKPFFSDLKKRKLTPFQPAGTNALPFQAKPLDSFFKVSTGAFPQAKSPFGPFQVPQGGATPNPFQQLMPPASNVANPFAPVSQPDPVARPDGSAPIDQTLPGQFGGEGQVQPAAGEMPAEDSAP